MDWLAINIFVLIFGIDLLIGLPFYFKKKNAREAIEDEYEEIVTEMLRQDKIYNPHLRQLNKNLNIINYWLKTGKDPNENEEDKEKVEAEDRFFAGLMNPIEAKKWKKAVREAREKGENEDIKALRVEEFHCSNMDPCDVGQTEMQFYYGNDTGEYIYYCITPDFLEKKAFKQVVFFTTSRPTSLPIVYPHKYEGAQMLSLYKHPAQTVWFLKNWKLIREGLEDMNDDDDVDLDESIKEFDL